MDKTKYFVVKKKALPEVLSSGGSEETAGV